MREIETPTLIFPFFFRSFIFLFFLLVGGVRFSSIPAGGGRRRREPGEAGKNQTNAYLTLPVHLFLPARENFPPFSSMT
jgi:hypothetical protein